MKCTKIQISGLIGLALSCVVAETACAQGAAGRALRTAIQPAYKTTVSSAPGVPLSRQEILGAGSYQPVTLRGCTLSAALDSGIAVGALTGISSGIFGAWLAAISVDQTISGWMMFPGFFAGALVGSVPGFVCGTWKSYNKWYHHFDHQWKHNLQQAVDPLLVANAPAIMQEAKLMLNNITASPQAVCDDLFMGNRFHLARAVGLANTDRELTILTGYLQQIAHNK